MLSFFIILKGGFGSRSYEQRGTSTLWSSRVHKGKKALPVLSEWSRCFPVKAVVPSATGSPLSAPGGTRGFHPKILTWHCRSIPLANPKVFSYFSFSYCAAMLASIELLSDSHPKQLSSCSVRVTIPKVECYVRNEHSLSQYSTKHCPTKRSCLVFVL